MQLSNKMLWWLFIQCPVIFILRGKNLYPEKCREIQGFLLHFPFCFCSKWQKMNKLNIIWLESFHSISTALLALATAFVFLQSRPFLKGLALSNHGGSSYHSGIIQTRLITMTITLWGRSVPSSTTPSPQCGNWVFCIESILTQVITVTSMHYLSNELTSILSSSH